MNRRKPEFQSIDISAWPTVAYTEFDEASRRAFEVVSLMTCAPCASL